MLAHDHIIEQENHRVSVTISLPELSAEQMQELVNDLMMRMRYDNAQHFIFDMSQVNFMSSACIGVLVSFLQDLEHVRGRIALAGCKADVLFLFKVTRLDAIFTTFDDMDEARLAIETC